MAYISTAQMFDSKFVINPLNPSSNEKNISSKGEISPNMTKLGTHIRNPVFVNCNHQISTVFVAKAIATV